MAVIGIREFARHVSNLISEVEESREPAVITRRGRPVAMVVPINPEVVEDFVLSHAREFVEAMNAARAELAAGETTPLSAVLAELDAEESIDTPTKPRRRSSTPSRR